MCTVKDAIPRGASRTLFHCVNETEEFDLRRRRDAISWPAELHRSRAFAMPTRMATRGESEGAWQTNDLCVALLTAREYASAQ